ncbi:MAG TPA: FHA domain-containing protein [Kofleriaceae bacterium]|nr:FHA domain-containing protein [Kofleriaceae bacterium]
MERYVEIIHPNGAKERHSLARERVVLGRQPREGIPIPYAMELEFEHLLLVPRKDGCWLSIAEGARTPALVNGQRLDNGLVAWGSEVNLGPLWFKVVDAPGGAMRTSAGVPVPGAAPPNKVSLSTVLLSAALLAFAGWLFLTPADDGLPGMTSVAPPPLFGAPATCPDKDGAAAGPRAQEAADAALAKSQRYPFAAQDGVGAVELYRVAAACFAVVGKDSDADRARQSGAVLEERIQEDYRTHRLKLERAIEYRRTRQALIETQKLLDLVRHLDHPYTTWLRNMERHLLLKTGSK